jgi:SsrA-binding protein
MKGNETGRPAAAPRDRDTAGFRKLNTQKKEKVITLNKKAFHDYEISGKYEAGLVLNGTEVKSLRLHKASIQESYARVKNGEVWLINSNIPAYKFGSTENHEPLRDRKVLLHRNEIKKISTKLQDKGFTLIPLKLYFSGSKAKVELGIARGKKFYDKREAIKRADIKRRLKRVMSN